ncbi:MAG: metallophosphoesterase [Ignavibacteriae bacterium]|nr:metallophosphoesterase [Ignavibacteriota bacterium]
MKKKNGVILVIFLTELLAASAVYAQSTVRFAVIGDYGLAGQAESDVSNLVKSWNPDLIITTGDNNYENGADLTIDQNIGQYYHEFISPYVGSYGVGDTINRFFPSLGNHDWRTAGALPYLNYFTLPSYERYYNFVWGPVHFFAVDSDTNEPDGQTSTSIQAQWLQSTMSISSLPWKIVYMHHPPYSSSSRHGSTPSMQWPYKEWGATAILAGHDHTYERIFHDSLTYVVNGLGGKSIYSFGTSVSGSQVRYNADYGAMLVTATTEAITFQFITRKGIVIDTYTITSKYTIAVNLQDGWNIVSVPVRVLDPRTLILFPSAISDAHSYETSGYQVRDTLQKGIGYWLKFTSPQNVNIVGQPVGEDTIDVETGWNIIGSISNPVLVNEIIQLPSEIVVSPYFEYSGKYIVADSIMPGRGYWVKVNQTGKLILSSTTAVKRE